MSWLCVVCALRVVVDVLWHLLNVFCLLVGLLLFVVRWCLFLLRFVVVDCGLLFDVARVVGCCRWLWFAVVVCWLCSLLFVVFLCVRCFVRCFVGACGLNGIAFLLVVGCCCCLQCVIVVCCCRVLCMVVDCCLTDGYVYLCCWFGLVVCRSVSMFVVEC